MVLIATGREVQIAVAARELLEAEGIPTRVVSMPCVEWFRAQDEAYRRTVLPPDVKARVSVEAGVALGWHEWVGDAGECVGAGALRGLRARTASCTSSSASPPSGSSPPPAPRCPSSA